MELIDLFVNAWYSEQWYLVLLVAVLGVVYLYLMVDFIRHLRKTTFNKRKTVLVCGPSDAGKTALFHVLRDGGMANTVTSMKEVHTSLLISRKHFADGNPYSVEILDYPGHERLRSGVQDFYPITGKIVFMVDGANQKSFRKAAEYLYDIFSHAQINDHAPPMLIVCNKADLTKTFVTAASLKDILQKELTELKKTRSSLEAEGEEDDPNPSGTTFVPVGRENQPFEFDVDSPCECQFVHSSVLSQTNVDQIAQFMIS